MVAAAIKHRSMFLIVACSGIVLVGLFVRPNTCAAAPRNMVAMWMAVSVGGAAATLGGVRRGRALGGRTERRYCKEGPSTRLLITGAPWNSGSTPWANYGPRPSGTWKLDLFSCLARYVSFLLEVGDVAWRTQTLPCRSCLLLLLVVVLLRTKQVTLSIPPTQAGAGDERVA